MSRSGATGIHSSPWSSSPPMNRLPVFLALVLLLPVQAAGLPRESRVPGGIAIVPLDGGSPPTAVYLGKRRVMTVQDHDKWLAIVGIPLETPPGQLRLTITSRAGKGREEDIDVAAKAYAEQHLTVKNRRHVHPTGADMQRIERERGIKEKMKASWRPEAPDLSFVAPIDGRRSGSFGLRRFFNGEPRRPHSGMDIATPRGTPVRAPSPGRVLYTGNFFFSGNMVYLDHGSGLISLYAHLDRIRVRPGQDVGKGEIIGDVGATGRVTGPHLHWTVYLNGTAVNPALFVPGP